MRAAREEGACKQRDLLGGYALRQCGMLAASTSLSVCACCAGDDEEEVVFLDRFVAAHGQECGQSRCPFSLRFPAVPGGSSRQDTRFLYLRQPLTL